MEPSLVDAKPGRRLAKCTSTPRRGGKEKGKDQACGSPRQAHLLSSSTLRAGPIAEKLLIVAIPAINTSREQPSDARVQGHLAA